MKAKKPKPPEAEKRKPEKPSHLSTSYTEPKVKRLKTSKKSTSEPQPLMCIRIQRPANLPPVISTTWRDSSTNIPRYNEITTPSSSRDPPRPRHDRHHSDRPAQLKDSWRH
uniref:Uncharacterized protein n=1 Tax=Acrobeloides nanus TaxID=290746 RepID=A0A914CZV3_9BILA